MNIDKHHAWLLRNIRRSVKAGADYAAKVYARELVASQRTRDAHRARRFRALATAALALALALPALAQQPAEEWTRCESGDVKMEVAVVNVNEATADQLQNLYRVGPATAAKIVAGRPYASPVDVLRVKGLGPAWWRSNGLHVVTEGATTLTAKVGQAAEEEAIDWTCNDGRTVSLEVEESTAPAVAGTAARRVVQ